SRRAGSDLIRIIVESHFIDGSIGSESVDQHLRRRCVGKRSAAHGFHGFAEQKMYHFLLRYPDVDLDFNRKLFGGRCAAMISDGIGCHNSIWNHHPAAIFESKKSGPPADSGHPTDRWFLQLI